MPNVKANGIQIEYDTFGNSSHQALLLISGMQMIFWPEEFCEKLADNDLFVIRFDNRDAGLSTKFDEAGVPDIMAAISAVMQGQKFQAPYRLEDLADDAIGLLDTLGIEKAHICGHSMGGRITQIIGYRHPSRVLSLIPISCNTGNPDLPRPKQEVLATLFAPVPQEREAFIENQLNLTKFHLGSFPGDDEEIRRSVARSFDRAHHPAGAARKVVATVTNVINRDHLSTIDSPTLVIRGSEDFLAVAEGAREIAESIHNADLLTIDGMGHFFTREGWFKIADAITKHTKKATDR